MLGHTCRVGKKTTLESFTVTFCVCGRKHHPHASHGNGICLFQKNLVSSSCVSHFSFPSFLYINFNSWPSHLISVMAVDYSDCEPQKSVIRKICKQILVLPHELNFTCVGGSMGSGGEEGNESPGNAQCWGLWAELSLCFSLAYLLHVEFRLKI